MRKVFYLLFVLSIFSCKKDNSLKINPSPEMLKDVPLTIGSYWVYEYYNVDTVTGMNQNLNMKDSIVIVSDTVLNGKKYVVRMGNVPFSGMNTWGIIDIVRDSSGYLVNAQGTVLFAENNFIDTFNVYSFVAGNNDTLAEVFYTMELHPDPIITPSGTYLGGLNYRGTVFQNTNNIPSTKYLHNIYVKNIGKVFETTFFLGISNSWVEKRLSNYFIQP